MDWIEIMHICSWMLWFGVFTLATAKGCVGRGKYITLPWVEFYAKRRAKQIIKRWEKEGQINFNHVYNEHWTGPQFRWRHQLLWFYLAFFILWGFQLSVGIPDHVYVFLACSVFYWPTGALYVDDLLSSIDKDKWKKRFKALKNKVKWKWVPVPVPVPTR